MLRYLKLIYFHLKWALNFLLHYSFFQNRQYEVPESGEGLWLGQYDEFNPAAACKESTECAVCLCKIEGGEEIRELRCEHVFHRACLDRWIGFRARGATCPLCRDFLGRPPRRAVTELGMEVLVFNYCSFDSRDRDAWWLR